MPQYQHSSNTGWPGPYSTTADTRIRTLDPNGLGALFYQLHYGVLVRFEVVCVSIPQIDLNWFVLVVLGRFCNSKTTEKKCILLILKMKLLKIWISWRWKKLYFSSQKLKINWSNWKVAILKIKWSKREKKVYVVYTQNEPLRNIFKMIYYKGIFHWEKKNLCPGLAHCCLI